MKEIKFRAKKKDTGEWVYGYSDGPDRELSSDDVEYLSQFWGMVENGILDPRTVGQRMGRKGGNGQEVYEDVDMGEFLIGVNELVVEHLESLYANPELLEGG